MIKKHMIENGRSMTEMLGVLAIIGVLSVGAIAGYSYGMDRYRANETINDIHLRMTDLFTQITQHPTVEPNLSNVWGTKGTVYSMDVAQDPTTLEYTLEVSNIPSRVCEMIFHDLIHSYSIGVGTTRYDNTLGLEGSVCKNDNVMAFYIQKCSGMDEARNCMVCPDGQEWFDSVGNCRLANGCTLDRPVLARYCEDMVCKECTAPAYYQDGQCICDGIMDSITDPRKTSCTPCVAPAYAENGGCSCPNGYIKQCSNTECIPCIAPAYSENGQCACPDNHVKISDTECFECPTNSTPNASKTACICNDTNIEMNAGTCENPTLYNQANMTCNSSALPLHVCPTKVAIVGDLSRPTRYVYPNCIYPAED